MTFGFTLLNITCSLILSPIHFFCSFLYSVLPPGDEDLKGNEVEVIVKFKRGLGLDDVDAANMHMEVLPHDPSLFVICWYSSMLYYFSHRCCNYTVFSLPPYAFYLAHCNRLVDAYTERDSM